MLKNYKFFYFIKLKSLILNNKYLVISKKLNIYSQNLLIYSIDTNIKKLLLLLFNKWNIISFIKFNMYIYLFNNKILFKNFEFIYILCYNGFFINNNYLHKINNYLFFYTNNFKIYIILIFNFIIKYKFIIYKLFLKLLALLIK